MHIYDWDKERQYVTHVHWHAGKNLLIQLTVSQIGNNNVNNCVKHYHIFTMYWHYMNTLYDL